MTFMRTAFMICVPLFLLITGYLMNSKELNVKYYHGIIHTLQIYIVSTILCILFERYYLHNNLSIKYAVFSIFGGDIAYSWYVEMYIGLFLLIPFLNILYHGLETQKRKQFLIVTLLFLYSLSFRVIYLCDFNSRLVDYALPDNLLLYRCLLIVIYF